jgi:hypothetical protein
MIAVYPVEVIRAAQAPAALWSKQALWVTDTDGLFSAPERIRSTRVYDPVVEGTALLLAAMSLNADVPEEVLRFVQEWGLLGAAHPLYTEEGRVAVDGVTATRETLRDVGRLGRWLAAMHARRWRDPAVIAGCRLDVAAQIALKHRVRTSPTPRQVWWFFKEHLNAALARVVGMRLQVAFEGDAPVPPQIKQMSTGPVFPVLCVLTVHDALYLELWRQLQNSPLRLRLCEGCPLIFPAARTKREQRYHSRACQTRAANAKWYQKKENRERRNARRRKGEGKVSRGRRRSPRVRTEVPAR